MKKKRKRKSKQDFAPVLRNFEELLIEVSEVPKLPSSGTIGIPDIGKPSEARPQGEIQSGVVTRVGTPSAAIFLEQVQEIFLRRIRESKER